MVLMPRWFLCPVEYGTSVKPVLTAQKWPIYTHHIAPGSLAKGIATMGSDDSSDVLLKYRP